MVDEQRKTPLEELFVSPADGAFYNYVLVLVRPKGISEYPDPLWMVHNQLLKSEKLELTEDLLMESFSLMFNLSENGAKRDYHPYPFGKSLGEAKRATVAASTAEVAVPTSVVGRAGAQVASRVVAGIVNSIGSYYITNASRNSNGTANGVSLATNFLSGYFGTQAGQVVPNPTGAPAALFGATITGANILTETFRAQLGELTQALTSYLSTLRQSQSSTNSNQKNKT